MHIQIVVYGGKTMSDDNNLAPNDVTFNQYKGWFEKYRRNNDTREINFQNEVIKRFIRGICTDLDVESCDTKLTTTRHDYLQYCGTYISNGKEKPSTPDLVITKEWNWFNREYNLDYRAVVEVKSPFGKGSIYSKGYINYSSDLKCELKRHLSAKVNEKVILTDVLKWEFYIRSEDGIDLKPIRTIELYDLTDGRGHWEWKKDEQVMEELKEFLKEFLNFNI